MPNINAFRPVIHGTTIYQNFPYFAPYWAQKGASPLYLNKSESPCSKYVSYQLWLKLAWWFLRRSRLKEKVDDGQTTDSAPWQKLSWSLAR